MSSWGTGDLYNKCIFEALKTKELIWTCSCEHLHQKWERNHGTDLLRAERAHAKTSMENSIIIKKKKKDMTDQKGTKKREKIIQKT